MNIWDNQGTLERLEKQRDKLRESGKRLTFDCMNLKLDRERAFCSKGKLLGQARDGSLFLILVLRGICSGACKNCGWFDIET